MADDPISSDLVRFTSLAKKVDDRRHGTTDAVPSVLAPLPIPRPVRRRIRYYFPIFDWARKSTWRSVARDFFAGIAVAMLLVPQGVAYSSLAGESVRIGLVSCVVPPVVYALTGHSRQTSVGPGALESILTGTFVASLSPDEADQGARILALAVGTVTFALGLLRLGFTDATMSPPVMKGFQNAVAIELMFSQMAALFGVSAVNHAASAHPKGWQSAWFVLHHLKEANLCSVLLGSCTIVALLSSKKLKAYMRWPLLPDTVIILAAVTGIAAVGEFSARYSLPLLGDTPIPRGLPTPGFPSHVADKDGNMLAWTVVYGQALANAVIIVLIGFVGVVAVSKRMSQRHQYTCSANRELVALGLTNLVSSYFGAMPTFVSMARSELADSAGAGTQIFGLVAAGLSLVAAFWLTPALALLPKCAVSALVIVAATGLFEVKHAVFLVTTRAWADLALLVFTFAATVTLGVETGVLLALMASLLQLVRRAASPHVSVMGRVGDSEQFADISENADAMPLDGVLVVRIDEVNMHSANAPPLMTLLDRLERLGSFHLFSDDSIYARAPSQRQPDQQALDELIEPDTGRPTLSPGQSSLNQPDRGARLRPPAPRSIIFDMQRVREIDSTALSLLLDLADGCAARNVHLAFVQPGEEVRRRLAVANITRPGGPQVHPSISAAIAEMAV